MTTVNAIKYAPGTKELSDLKAYLESCANTLIYLDASSIKSRHFRLKARRFQVLIQELEDLEVPLSNIERKIIVNIFRGAAERKYLQLFSKICGIDSNEIVEELEQ